MEKQTDSVLERMQEIKELLFGIGLIAVSIALSVLGMASVFLSGYYGGLWEITAVVLWFAAVVTLVCGFTYICHGWTAQKPAEKERAEN